MISVIIRHIFFAGLVKETGQQSEVFIVTYLKIEVEYAIYAPVCFALFLSGLVPLV